MLIRCSDRPKQFQINAKYQMITEHKYRVRHKNNPPRERVYVRK